MLEEQASTANSAHEQSLASAREAHETACAEIRAEAARVAGTCVVSMAVHYTCIPINILRSCSFHAALDIVHMRLTMLCIHGIVPGEKLDKEAQALRQRLDQLRRQQSERLRQLLAEQVQPRTDDACLDVLFV